MTLGEIEVDRSSSPCGARSRGASASCCRSARTRPWRAARPSVCGCRSRAGVHDRRVELIRPVESTDDAAVCEAAHRDARPAARRHRAGGSGEQRRQTARKCGRRTAAPRPCRSTAPAAAAPATDGTRGRSGPAARPRSVPPRPVSTRRRRAPGSGQCQRSAPMIVDHGERRRQVQLPELPEQQASPFPT